jgi:hypothetical protein
MELPRRRREGHVETPSGVWTAKAGHTGRPPRHGRRISPYRRPRRHGRGPKPTIVLEQGAWADSGSWDAVIQRLQADGYAVDAPPNPLQGPAYLADFLDSISGPIALVGHSYGGAVITKAATGGEQVKPSSTSTPSRPHRARPIAQLLAAYRGHAPRQPTLTSCHSRVLPPEWAMLISSRACSRPAWPTVCPPRRRRSSPPRSGRWPRSR